MQKIKIVSINEFDAYIILEGKDPQILQICKTDSNEIVIEFNTDAVDCMGFSDISSQLEKFPEKEQQAAVNCLAEALKHNYGGKNFLAIPEKL